MFGFLFGALCLVGLVKVLRHDHPLTRHHHGPGPGRWPKRMLRRALRRLDTTPGQERIIREAFDDVAEAAEGLRGQGRRLRHDLADVLRTEDLDRAGVDSLLSRHEDEFDALREAVAGAITEVHAALEPSQRERLAEMLGRQGHHHHGGPYRSSWA